LLLFFFKLKQNRKKNDRNDDDDNDAAADDTVHKLWCQSLDVKLSVGTSSYIVLVTCQIKCHCYTSEKNSASDILALCACVLSFNEARTTRLRPSQGQMFEAKVETKAKALRSRPTFWPLIKKMKNCRGLQVSCQATLLASSDSFLIRPTV